MKTRKLDVKCIVCVFVPSSRVSGGKRLRKKRVQCILLVWCNVLVAYDAKDDTLNSGFFFFKVCMCVCVCARARLSGFVCARGCSHSRRWRRRRVIPSEFGRI